MVMDVLRCFGFRGKNTCLFTPVLDDEFCRIFKTPPRFILKDFVAGSVGSVSHFACLPGHTHRRYL